MRIGPLLSAFLLAGTLMVSSSAYADTLYDYTITFNAGIVQGYPVGGGTLVFSGPMYSKPINGQPVNHTLTYVSGSLDGFVPTTADADFDLSDLVIESNANYNLPEGSVGVALAWFTILNGKFILIQVTPGVSASGGELAFGNPGGSISIAPEVASTPEPSSIALLGTGLLGAVGAVRRRFTKQISD